MKRTAIAAACSAALSACCAKQPPAVQSPTPSAGSAATAEPPLRHDVHSFAEPDRVAVRSVSLDLTVDFTLRQIAGTAKLELDRKDPAATEVLLDTQGLAIQGITACGGGPLPFVLAPPVPILGRALHVTLGDATCIAVAYHTSPDAGALLWVDPAGTAGKQHPMLFTQSESIYARSWIPLQDTPGVRFTYDATIHAPVGVRPLMSATNPDHAAADGAWHFTMEHPIPSYLMALAVGDFVFRPIGKATGVYAEPSVADAAAWEFAEVDQMVAAAEQLYGPYRWGRYDMLVLPPSFPFGGMENPRLTFLTPTAITGDRALVSLIAHELAHSWSGNLVTNSTWSDSWLNEGFTTYVEARIMELLRGPAEAEIDWYLSARDLQEKVKHKGADDPDSVLAQDLTADQDPEDYGGYVYSKGSWFLRELERAFGRPAFDAFLKARFDRHAFHSSDSRTFEAEVTAQLYAKAPAGAALPDLHEWLHGTGVPGLATLAVPPPAVAAIEAQATRFAASGGPVVATDWTTTEWVVFLRALPGSVDLAKLATLDTEHHLTQLHNAEIGMYWLPLLVRSNDREAAPAVEAYLLAVGRVRMISPLYRALMKGDDAWQALARSTYARAEPMYHPIARAAIRPVLAGG